MSKSKSEPVEAEHPALEVRGEKIDLRITVGTARRLRAQYKFDVPNLITDQESLYDILYSDPERLCEIGYAIAGSGCGLSFDEWCDEFDGRSLPVLRGAIEAACLDFFEDPAKRRVLTAQMEAMREAHEAAAGAVIAEIAVMDKTQGAKAAVKAARSEEDGA